jgi:DNA helicase HerA-like ATPase
MFHEYDAFCRLEEIPLRAPPEEAGRRSDPTSAQLVAALISAHAGGGSVTMAWVRRWANAPVEVLLGGDAALGITDDDPVRPLYPPGSRGRRLSRRQALDTLAQFPAWLRCGGVSDVLTLPSPDAPVADARGTFEDYVAHLARTPFAWLVAGEPLGFRELRQELDDLSSTIPIVRERRSAMEAERVDLERKEARFRELARAETAGLWRVHLLVGGADEGTVRRTAALLCNASELVHQPYTLRPGVDVLPFEKALEQAYDAGPLGASPFRATSELLAVLARPPARELPGVRLVAPNSFDVTPESVGELRLGTVLDEGLDPAGPFGIARSTLNRHVFVCGATGAGKSQTVRGLLEELAAQGIPWLVIEPAKAEYARMAGRLRGRGEVLVIRPGEADVVPASLNPLEPEPGFPLQTHIDLVRALFLAAFEAHEPFPQVLSYALTRCYEELGWELALGTSRSPSVLPKYPSLGDLQRTAKDVVEHIGYGPEVTADVRGFIDVRLGSLRLGTPGRFFEGGHPVDVADLLDRNVVLELEDVGNDQDKAFFIGTVLIRLVEHLRQRYGHHEGSVELRHVTVVEEAHRLLKAVDRESPSAHAVELFAGLLAEIRAYGEGIVVAEQIPSKILPDVIKNTALKIVHRLPAHDDRFTVGATMNLDERQSEYVVTLPPGRAAAFADGMDRPLLVEMPLGEHRETAEGSSRTVSVARTRSVACGMECHARPCTLREMTAARQLADDPRLILWIELLTVAHLVGEPEPLPDPAWLEGLRRSAPVRVLECAVGHLVQAAIDARYVGLAADYQPEALARHLAARAGASLLGADGGCDGSEVEWQAGRFRWVDVVRSLQRADGDRSGRHPRSQEWADRGLDLQGSTWDEQLAELRLHPSSWLPSYRTIPGAGEPPAIERAAARLSSNSDPVERLTQAAGFLSFTWPWPVARLYPAQWRAGGGSRGR